MTQGDAGDGDVDVDDDDGDGGGNDDEKSVGDGGDTVAKKEGRIMAQVQSKGGSVGWFPIKQQLKAGWNFKSCIFGQ